MLDLSGARMRRCRKLAAGAVKRKAGRPAEKPVQIRAGAGTPHGKRQKAQAVGETFF